MKETKQLQQFSDKCLRYIWSDKTRPPLRQMQAKGRNMQDMRNELGVKSIRWKIERRLLERISHIMRMEDTRQTRVAVLGDWKTWNIWRNARGEKGKPSSPGSGVRVYRLQLLPHSLVGVVVIATGDNEPGWALATRLFMEVRVLARHGPLR